LEGVREEGKGGGRRIGVNSVEWAFRDPSLKVSTCGHNIPTGWNRKDMEERN